MGITSIFTILIVHQIQLFKTGGFMSISNYLDSVAKPFQGLAPWILKSCIGSFIYIAWVRKISFASRKNGYLV